MVDAHFVYKLVYRAEPLYPPAIAVGSHGLVVVQRIAPQLAIGAEIIGRHAGDGRGIAAFVQLEQLLMSPAVGAVVGDKHGHVTEDLHAVVMGIFPKSLPLAVENILQEFIMGYGAGQFFFIIGYAVGSVAADIVGPLCPDLASEEIADRTEQGVVVEPVGVFLAEIGVRRPRHVQVFLMGHTPERVLLDLPGFVPGFRIPDGFLIFAQFFGRQPSPFVEHIEGNEPFVPGKGRSGQIGRIAHERRRQRQDLP